MRTHSLYSQPIVCAVQRWAQQASVANRHRCPAIAPLLPLQQSRIAAAPRRRRPPLALLLLLQQQQ